MQVTIQPVSQALAVRLRELWDGKLKPPGSLGRLEDWVVQLGLIQQTETPTLKPEAWVFAADHGLAQEGVSAYPQSVTALMVEELVKGAAAQRVLCRAHGIPLQVVDVGVATELPSMDGLHLRKVAPGTQNSLRQSAMTGSEVQQAMQVGFSLMQQAAQRGINLVMLGEMGIANTSAAALVAHRLTEMPLATLVGPGTGLQGDGLARKRSILLRAVQRAPNVSRPLDVLAEYGGLEIAALTGAILGAAASRMAVLLDGYISTVAALAAVKMAPECKGYLLFSHVGSEPGHGRVLVHLEAKPILDLSLRLGEGTGAALAYPLLKAALTLFNQMGTLEGRGIAPAAGS